MKTITAALVDDDKIFQFITGKILKALPEINKTLQFGNGQEFYDYICKNYNEADALPDVVFLDIQMPFMDGWQFMQEFTNLDFKLAKDININILSSSISLYDKEKAKIYKDIKNYFVKPIAKEEFPKIISAFL
ncbi:MAG: response regulator [Ignavibacteria bacterium]|nr:response regulator [Ignavibacteria bacterium]